MIAPIILAVDFMNFTYTKHPCQSNVPVPAVMRKGAFSYFDRKAGNGFDLSIDSVHEGSLAPGTRQAVVVIDCEFPGAVGGTAGAFLYDERKTSTVLLQQVGGTNWGPDWGGRPYSIHIRFANRFLYVDQCKNDVCEQYVVTTYALRNGKLAKVFAQTHKRQRP